MFNIDQYLEPINISNNIYELECSICIGTLESNEWCKISCKHLFHNECIKKWLEKSKSCPNCKSELKIIQISYLTKKEILIYNKTTEFINQLDEKNKKIIINLAKNNYTKIKVESYQDLDLSLLLIDWYILKHSKKMNDPLYDSFRQQKIMYGNNLFEIFTLNTSKLIEYRINNQIINLTFGQANFFCWFIKLNVLNQIINFYKLFMSQESFYCLIELDL